MASRSSNPKNRSLRPASTGRGTAAKDALVPGPASPGSGAEHRLKTANIMFDPRVVRGNTWAASTLAKLRESQQQQPATKPSPTIRKKRTVKPATPEAVKTPRPVEGRQHIELQTETFLQELDESFANTQTEVGQTEAAQTEVGQPEAAQTEQEASGVLACQSCDATTQIEAGDLPDPEAEAKAKAAEEAAYWAAVEEEQQAALKRQQEIIEQERREEAARLEHEVKEREEAARLKDAEDKAYAEQFYACQIAAELAAELVEIATGAAATVFLHDAVDVQAVQHAEAVRKAQEGVDQLLGLPGSGSKPSPNVLNNELFDKVSQVNKEDSDEDADGVDTSINRVTQ